MKGPNGNTNIYAFHIFGLNVCVHPWIHSTGEIWASRNGYGWNILAVTYDFYDSNIQDSQTFRIKIYRYDVIRPAVFFTSRWLFINLQCILVRSTLSVPLWFSSNFVDSLIWLWNGDMQISKTIGSLLGPFWADLRESLSV